MGMSKRKGYVLKGASSDEIVRAVAAVGHGEAFFSPEIARRLGHYFGKPVDGEAAYPRLYKLTGKERDVLKRIAAGWSTARRSRIGWA